MKKIGIFLALVLVLTCAAGCAKKEPSAATDKAAADAPAADTVYTIYAFGDDNKPLEGVAFTFCTETACYPVATNAEGVAAFTGPAAKYHVELVSAPAGLKPDESAEGCSGGDFYTEPRRQEFRIRFTKDAS